MTVEVRDNPEEARYEIRDDGELAGSVEYRLSEGRITLVHTAIDAAHAHRGLASVLARAALEDARKRGLAVVPRCSFIARFIRQNADDYLALVVPSMRKRVMQDDR